MLLLESCSVFFLFVTGCYAIAEEYYDDDDPKVTNIISHIDDDELFENITAARRASVKQKENVSIINRKNKFDRDNYIDLSDDNLSDDDFKVYVINNRNMKERQRKMSTEVENKIRKTTTVKHTKITLPKFVRTTVPTLADFFLKDYEYIYDDVNTSTSKMPLILQPSTPSTTTENIDAYEQNHSKIYYTDFYNLAPAVNIPKNNKDSFPNNNEWYVPQMYPCWQLPVLYGELGKGTKPAQEIFIINRANLKNVVVLGEKKIPKLISYELPITTTHNKWCEVEPCYGDHTLCLFSDNTVSKICDSKYRVRVPTTLEQIALVNTVNSMRNRIANGAAKEYPQLPTASNMKQMLYDYDLEKMAAAWLRQCLPGPPPCSALDGQYVSQLECTKYAAPCCFNSFKIGVTRSKCIPKDECFVPAVIGCIYAWFLHAGNKIKRKDVDCGHIESSTYNTAQLIWAHTNKMGCAYGQRANGDIRVVCDFAPGAPYFIITKYYCGFISHKDITRDVMMGEDHDIDFTNLTLLSSFGLNLKSNIFSFNTDLAYESKVFDGTTKNAEFIKSSGLNGISELYRNAQLRQILNDYSNVTRAMVARLVTRYTFFEESESRCDTNEPMYAVGTPGSLCMEKGRRFHALCYDFRDPTPGYRLVAVIAPVALFSLILYDLFSGVVRQTN